METIELERTPEIGALFRRAALGSLPGVRRRRPAATVPDTELVLRGVAVDRAHLVAYDRVCGFRVTDALPATYPHVLAFPLALALMAAPDFPLPMVGVVHVANRITVRRPIDAGERLDIAVRAADLRPHERGQQVDIVAVGSINGAEVWRGVSTYLRREGGRARRGGDRPAPPEATAVWRVPSRVGREYAEVSGDHNPIHTSRLAARLFGFPRTIAHGMWSKARCLAALEGRLPDAYTVDVAFKLPLLLPATVGFTARPGWSFAMHDARAGSPYLSGTLTADPAGATAHRAATGGRPPN
jgi:acyl dehydratase